MPEPIRNKFRFSVIILSLSGFMIFTFLVAPVIGENFGQLFSTDVGTLILFELRYPRVVFAFLVGLSLALIGFLIFGPDTLISGAAAQDFGGEGAAGSAAGIINGLGSIGAILQGIITPYVSERYGWEALFYLFVVLAIFAGLVLLPLALKKK